MFCSNCGKPNESAAQFCYNCGVQLETDDFVPNVPIKSTAPQAEVDSLLLEDNGAGEYNEPIVADNIVVATYYRIKPYIIYPIIAGLIWTFFSLLTVKGEGGIEDDDERRSKKTKLNGAQGKFTMSGLQMYSGALPTFSFSEMRNGVARGPKINNQVLKTEVTKLGVRYKKLLRTPLIFRTAYIVLSLSILFLIYTLLFKDKSFGKSASSLVKIIGFASCAALIWSFNEFELYGDKMLEIANNLQPSGMDENAQININSSYSFGLWLIFTGFLLYLIEYIYDTFKYDIKKLGANRSFQY